MESVEWLLFLTKYILCLSVSLPSKNPNARIKERHLEHKMERIRSGRVTNKHTNSTCSITRSFKGSFLPTNCAHILVDIGDLWCNLPFFSCDYLCTGQTGCFVCIPEERLRQSVCDATSPWRQGEKYGQADIIKAGRYDLLYGVMKNSISSFKLQDKLTFIQNKAINKIVNQLCQLLAGGRWKWGVREVEILSVWH